MPWEGGREGGGREEIIIKYKILNNNDYVEYSYCNN